MPKIKVRKKSMVDERSRTQLIIDEIECGGFTEDELDEIVSACVKAQEQIN